MGHKLKLDASALQALYLGEMVSPSDKLLEHAGMRKRSVLFILIVISETILPPISICGFSIFTYHDPRAPGVIYYVWTWPHKGYLISVIGISLPKHTFRVITSLLLLLTLYASKTTDSSKVEVFIGRHHTRVYQWAVFIQGLPLLYREMGVGIALVIAILYNRH